MILRNDPFLVPKTIQDWFAHHGEALYEELKHVRNQLYAIQTLLRQNNTQSTEDIVTPLAQAHAVLAVQNRRKKHADTQQINLL